LEDRKRQLHLKKGGKKSPLTRNGTRGPRSRNVQADHQEQLIVKKRLVVAHLSRLKKKGREKVKTTVDLPGPPGARQKRNQHRPLVVHSGLVLSKEGKGGTSKKRKKLKAKPPACPFPNIGREGPVFFPANWTGKSLFKPEAGQKGKRSERPFVKKKGMTGLVGQCGCRVVAAIWQTARGGIREKTKSRGKERGG